MKGLGLLLCGNSIDGGIAHSALNQLQRSIVDFSERSISYLNSPMTAETLSFGPFCARVVLENSCAALVGRLDAFRLMYLSEFQSQPHYEPGKRARSSFSWTGDVMPESDQGDLWSLSSEVPKIGRALFSRHADHMYWRPAIDKMLDFLAARSGKEVPGDLHAIDAENYVSATKGRCSQIYSTLSKGVHWEFFSSAFILDEATIKSLIRETIIIIGQLGLISNFIPTACTRVPPVRALRAYRELRREVP